MSQEFDSSILDLFKRKGFYPYEYVSDFGKVKEELPIKEKFYSLLMDKKIVIKNINMFFKYEIDEMNTMEDNHDLYLTCDVLLLADVFEKF